VKVEFQVIQAGKTQGRTAAALKILQRSNGVTLFQSQQRSTSPLPPSAKKNGLEL